MKHADDIHRLRSDAVNENVVRVNHGLTSAVNPTGTIHLRVLREAFGAGLYGVFQSLSGGVVAVGDVGDNLIEIGARLCPPDELQLFFLSSMIFCTPAITS